MVAWISLGISVAGLALSLYYMSKMPGAPRPEGFQAPKIGEGVPIPVLFGTKDIAPQILWYGNLAMGWNRKTYYASLHFGLCHGKLDAITAVICDDKVCWRGWASSDLQLILAKTPGATFTLKANGGPHDLAELDNDGFDGPMYVRMGGVNPNNGAEASPTTWPANMLAKIMGQAKVPHGYGVAQVWTGGYGHNAVGKSSYMRPVVFRCQRIHYYQGGTTQWYDAKAAISIGIDCEDEWKYKVQASADATDYSGAAYDDSAWSIGRGGFSNAPVGAQGTKTTLVGTCISGVDGLSGDHRVERGMKIWLRQTFAAMPKSKYGIWLYHDDSARVWWNGTELTVAPVIDIENYGGEAAGVEFHRFNSRAEVPEALVDDAGPNVIAVRVRDSYNTDGDLVVGASTEFIFAGCRVGADMANPVKSSDLNPIHAIREVLTDEIWGMAHPSADIDATSFEAAADTCYTERLGISLLWDRQSSAEDFIQEILRHISGVLYIDRATGTYVIKLIREDYVVGNLLTLDDTNTAKLQDVSQRSTAELINSVTVTYSATPRGLDGAVTLHEYGLQAVQGGVTSQKIDYPGFSNYFSAGKAALRDLRVLSSPLRSCTILAGRVASSLNIGDAFVLDKPAQGFDEQVMRVSKISLGNGRSNQVKIEAVEDVFYMPTKPVVVPAPVYYPPEILAPLPSDVKATKFYLSDLPDPRDHGSVFCCFLGAHVAGGNVPMFELDWDEVEPGVMQAKAVGPLTDAFFDDVASDYLNPSGVSSMIGKTVFAFYQGDTSINGLEERWQGIYIVDDVGAHFVDYGLPSQQLIQTYARMHRHPDYAAGSDYEVCDTFQVQQGTLYGTEFFTLDNDGVALGTTALTWTQTADPFPWVEEHRLLTAGEVANEGLRTTEVNMVASGDEGYEFATFVTMEGMPNIADIPAGTWAVHMNGVWLESDDPGETTTLEFAVYKGEGVGRVLLFSMMSAAIHTETVLTPLDIEAPAPGFHLERTDVLSVSLVIHTTAASVDLDIAYGGANPQSYILAPVTPRDWEIQRASFHAARFAGGVVVAPGRAWASRVALTDDLVGIESAGWEDGDCIDLILTGASSGTPYDIVHGATVGVGALPLALDSVSHLGTEYLDIELVTSPVCVRFQLDLDNSVWRLVGGPTG